MNILNVLTPFILHVHIILCSKFGIATGYGLDVLENKSRWDRHFPHLSRQALGTIQSPVQWVQGLYPRVKSGRGVTLTPHPILVPWSRKSRAIPLLPLWAIWPVQGLGACTRVHFSFFTFHASSYSFWRTCTCCLTKTVKSHVWPFSC